MPSRIFYKLAQDAIHPPCMFVDKPFWKGGPEIKCKHEATYRIGETIFLCGYHMPGFGRYKGKILEISEEVLESY